MALDTTIGGAAADSYGTLAACKAYFTAMGLTTTAADAVIETSLRRAAVFLDRTYEWKGVRRFETQALGWPRVVESYDPDGFAYPSDAIPQKVIHAQFEVAFIFASGNNLYAYTDGPEVKVREVGAGPAKVRTEYVSGSEDSARIRAIEGLLRAYITGGAPGGGAYTVKMTRG